MTVHEGQRGFVKRLGLLSGQIDAKDEPFNFLNAAVQHARLLRCSKSGHENISSPVQPWLDVGVLDPSLSLPSAGPKNSRVRSRLLSTSKPRGVAAELVGELAVEGVRLARSFNL